MERGGWHIVFEEDKNIQRWERAYVLAVGRKYSDGERAAAADRRVFGGTQSEKQKKSWKRVANQVDGKPIIRGLFDNEGDERVEAVKTGKVRVERMRCSGDVWLGLALWKKSGLDEFSAKQMERGCEAIDWDVMSSG